MGLKDLMSGFRVEVRTPSGERVQGYLKWAKRQPGESIHMPQRPLLTIDVWSYFPRMDTPWGPASELQVSLVDTHDDAADVLEAWQSQNGPIFTGPPECGHRLRDTPRARGEARMRGVELPDFRCQKPEGHADQWHWGRVSNPDRPGIRAASWDDEGWRPSERKPAAKAPFPRVSERPPPCGAPHPKRPGLTCKVRGPHDEHRALFEPYSPYAQVLFWKDEPATDE